MGHSTKSHWLTALAAATRRGPRFVTRLRLKVFERDASCFVELLQSVYRGHVARRRAHSMRMARDAMMVAAETEEIEPERRPVERVVICLQQQTTSSLLNFQFDIFSSNVGGLPYDYLPSPILDATAADSDDMTELANEAAAHVMKMQDEITAGVNYWLHMAKAINRPMILWYLTAEPAGDTQITETMESAWDFNAAEWSTQKTTDSITVYYGMFIGYDFNDMDAATNLLFLPRKGEG